jgi:hypothetical protein
MNQTFKIGFFAAAFALSIGAVACSGADPESVEEENDPTVAANAPPNDDDLGSLDSTESASRTSSSAMQRCMRFYSRSACTKKITNYNYCNSVCAVRWGSDDPRRNGACIRACCQTFRDFCFN